MSRWCRKANRTPRRREAPVHHVGLGRFELPTSCPPDKRANQAAPQPVCVWSLDAIRTNCVTPRQDESTSSGRLVRRAHAAGETGGLSLVPAWPRCRFEGFTIHGEPSRTDSESGWRLRAGEGVEPSVDDQPGQPSTTNPFAALISVRRPIGDDHGRTSLDLQRDEIPAGSVCGWSPCRAGEIRTPDLLSPRQAR